MLLKRIQVNDAFEFDNVDWTGYDGVVFENADTAFNVGGFIAPETDGFAITVVNNSGNQLNFSIPGDDVSSNSDPQNRITTDTGFDPVMSANSQGTTCILYYDLANSIWRASGGVLQ